MRHPLATLALFLLTPLPFALAQPPVASASPATAPVATPAPAPLVEDPAVTARALQIYSQMRAGKVDETLFTKQMQAAVTPELLAQNKPMFDSLGDPKELKLQAADKMDQGTNYTYLAIFPAAQFHITLFITTEGKIGGYFLKP